MTEKEATAKQRDMIRGMRHTSLEIDAVLLDCETQCGLEADEIERIEAAKEVEREREDSKDDRD